MGRRLPCDGSGVRSGASATCLARRLSDDPVTARGKGPIAEIEHDRPPKTVMTSYEAAAHLGVAVKTVQRMAARGELPATRAERICDSRFRPGAFLECKRVSLGSLAHRAVRRRPAEAPQCGAFELAARSDAAL